MTTEHQFEDLCKAWQGRSKMDRKQELQELREERINECVIVICWTSH